MGSISRAHAAIAEARKADAEQYAPVEMTRAVAAYELAENSIMEDSASGNSRAQKYAREAEAQALAAANKAREAKAREETTPPSPEDLPVIVAPPPPPPEEIERRNRVAQKRYVALARRRIQNVARNHARGNTGAGSLEIEVWVAPDGKVVQMLLIKGNPASEFAQRVLKGISSLQLEPFPAEMERDNLKVRVKIGTRRKGAGNR